jgi:microsomal dipeptidase-like Zn-dependent dipeptidase
MKHPISDLHVHCGLKGYANEGYPGYEDFTIWDYFPENKEELKKLNFVLKGAIKDTAKDSQAHLDACVESNLSAPFISIYPVERQMFDLDPLKPFRSIFQLLLKGKQHAYLGAAVSGFPLERVEKIIKMFKEGNKGVDYFKEFVKERDYLLRQQKTRSKKYPDYRFAIATNYEEFRAIYKRGQTITGLLTVEGAHAFGHYLFNDTFKREYEELGIEEKITLESSMIQNIRRVKTEAGGRYAPFFVTFCHHYNNLLAGHARSFSDKTPLLLGFNKPGMRHLFNQEKALGRGFTPLGREVLELMLDREQGRRMLVDCKHMSVATRQEFYEIIRKKREEENDSIPIIHGHAAINGWLSLDHAKDKEETAELDKGQFFSRWQINLTNEDILETYDSDGLIGLVLHEGRIPGDAFKKKAKKLKKKVDKARAGSAQKADLQKELLEMYMQLLWSNIFHIVKVVKENRPAGNAWKMIALGSDYDGLVDPMDSFPEVASFKTLKKAMIDYLNSGQTIFFSQNGEAKALPAEEVQALMFGQSPEDVLEGILFGNTDQFLSKYFTEAYLSQSGAVDDAVAA